MREIKFRVRGTTGDKLWFYLPLPDFFAPGNAIWYEGVDWNTFTQYTGLKDKNGKEIYEGDIVRRNTTTHSTKVIEWKTQLEMTGFNVGNFSDWEVIGNIYKNPELLK